MDNKLAYHHLGEGIPVLLLHGFCENKDIWSNLTPALSKEGQIIVPDLPGFGENAPIDLEITMESVAEELADFLKKLGIQQAIFVGHSLGGYLALALADLYPEMCLGLCLFHSTAKPDSEAKKIVRDKTTLFIEKNGTEVFAQNFVPSLFAPKNQERLIPEIEDIKQIVSQTSDKSAIAYTQVMRDRPDRIHVLENNQFPFLFIAGKEDQAVPYADLVLQSKLPTQGSTLISLENCAHMGMYEEEQACHEAITEFMKKIKAK